MAEETSDKEENKPLESIPKKKNGRPKGSKTNGKNKILAQLHKIWGDLNKHKPSEVIAAANLYAELQGWKLRKPEVSDSGEVMKIEFEKEAENLVKKVKVQEEFPVIKVEPKEVLLTHAQGSMGMPVVIQDVKSEVVNAPSETATTTTPLATPAVEVEFK